jgi:hypothetical protein
LGENGKGSNATDYDCVVTRWTEIIDDTIKVADPIGENGRTGVRGRLPCYMGKRASSGRPVRVGEPGGHVLLFRA